MGSESDDALVRVDGTVNWSTARHDAGDDDHAAMACAMAAANGDEVVGLCVGGGDTSFAAARGAERTVVLEGFPVPTDSMTMARAWLRESRVLKARGWLYGRRRLGSWWPRWWQPSGVAPADRRG